MSSVKAGESPAGQGRASSAAADAAGKKGQQKKVAECCLELLHIEIVALYTRMQHTQQQQPAQARNELMARRMEAIGFQVGQQLVERYTLDRSRFSEHLEVIKFICKDFWAEVFRKQVDNLKTNHRGVFVLQDNRFRWLLRISADVGRQPIPSSAGFAAASPGPPSTPSPAQSGGKTRGGTPLPGSASSGLTPAIAPSGPTSPIQAGAAAAAVAAAAAASQYLLLPCGIIKGALTNLGVPCTVTAEVTTLPACSFTIRIKS